jgi:hypothetical protein
MPFHLLMFSLIYYRLVVKASEDKHWDQILCRLPF